MNKKQIDELNELLVDHGPTLTSFYAEGIRYGMKKGLVIGAITSFIGCTSVIVFDKLKSQKSDKES